MKIICYLSIYRKQLKLTQKELANKIKVSRRTISLIENNENTNIDIAFKISKAINKKIEDIWKLNS